MPTAHATNPNNHFLTTFIIMKIKTLLSLILAGALTVGIASCDKKGHGNADDSDSESSDSVATSASAASTATGDAAAASDDPGEQIIAIFEQAAIDVQNASSKEEIQSIIANAQNRVVQIGTQNPDYKPTPDIITRGEQASKKLAEALTARGAELGIDGGDLE